jgi:microcystin-dependent protein
MALILPNTIANLTPADGAKVQQNFASIQSWANQEAITRDGSTAMTSPLLLPGAPTATNQAATKGYVDSSIPLGVMWEYAGDTAPANWMLCQGQVISRATYAALFAVIGVRFGAGDGSTTFSLPDMRGCYAFGHNAGGTYGQVGVGQRFGNKDSSLPSHQHGGVDHLHGVSIAAGATMSWGEVYQATQQPVDNIDTFGVRIGDGYQINMHKFQSSSYPGSVAVNGATGAADRSLTTGAAGGDATNTNLPPSVSLNYIMRVS